MNPFPTGDPVYLAYLITFAAAASGCFFGAWQARTTSLPGVRRGLTGLLVTSGLWGLCHVGVLLSASLQLKTAFYEVGLVAGFGAVLSWLWLCSSYSGRSLHGDTRVRWVAGAVFAAVTLAKLTNSWHGLYFSVEWGTRPFRHLMVDHHPLYWFTAAFSYTLAAVGFFMLVEPLRRAQVGTGRLAVLFGLTALPLGANALGNVGPYLLDLSHEPVGVAAFALGALVLRDNQLDEASQTGREERPSLVLSRDGTIRNYNRAAAELFPALREEKAARSPLEDILPRLSRALAGVAKGAGASDEEDVLAIDGVGEPPRAGEDPSGAGGTRAGGRTRYVRPEETSFQRGSRRLVVLIDVTEQVLRRREQASRLEVLFDQSPDMINVHDAKGRLLEANPRFLEETGYDEADLSEMRVWDLDQSISPESAVELWAEMDVGDRHQLEGTYRRKDGSTFPVEVHIRRLQLAGGGRFVVITRDITERKRAERERKRERDRLETLFESLPTPVVRCRLDGGTPTITDANPAFGDTFGSAGEEVEGKNLNALVAPEGLRAEAVEIDRCALEESDGEGAGEGPVETEVRRATAEGPRDFRLQVAGRTPEEGPPEVYAVYTDITERKRRERRLQQAETFFENAQDALFLIDVESDGADRGEGRREFSIRRVNPAYEAATGFSGEDLYGRPLQDIFGEEAGQGIEERYRRCVRRQKPIDYEEELPVGGEVTFWQTRIAPVIVEGEVRHIVGTTRDVTERRRQQRELERQNDLFERAQEIAKVGAWQFDLQSGEFRLTDQGYRVHGLPPGNDMTVERSHELFAPEDRSKADEAFRRAIEDGEPYDIEACLHTEDGEKRWVRTRGEPLWEDGEVARVRGTIQDITDRKRREEALREAKEEAEKAARLKSSMLANMSHEIRTPLTSIIGFAEAIGIESSELELSEESPLPRYADLIEKSGKRLLETLEGVLNLSKLEARQMELSAEPVGLADQARHVVEELRPEAAEKQVDLVVQVEDVQAVADQGGVQIVLRNLLSNAIKYTEKDGAVWVRTRQQEGSAVLEVEDTGVGMEAGMADQLFEPFRQASEGWGREYEGTGVGLTVTREATEQMGGSIEVETEEGKGSCFTVCLPLKEEGQAG